MYFWDVCISQYEIYFFFCFFQNVIAFCYPIIWKSINFFTNLIAPKHGLSAPLQQFDGLSFRSEQHKNKIEKNVF